MFEEDFGSKLKEKIELANLLVGLSDEDTESVHQLYLKKKEIMRKNSFFANIKMQNINKKIQKIKSKYSDEDIKKAKENLGTNSIFEPKKNNSQNISDTKNNK